jgi:hypothetical protein
VRSFGWPMASFRVTSWITGVPAAGREGLRHFSIHCVLDEAVCDELWP